MVVRLQPPRSNLYQSPRNWRPNWSSKLARYATVPVINGLTKRSHPCQVMADILTFEEHRGPIGGRKIAWSGDYNNVLSSWIDAAQRFDFSLDIACPGPLQPRRERLEQALAKGAKITLGEDPFAAVVGAAAVISDCWVSMGDEDEGRATICSRPIRSTAP